MAYEPILIQAQTLAEAWEKAVIAVMEKAPERFIQAPDYLCNQKDAPVFITVKFPLKEPRIHPKAPVQSGQAEEYAKNVIFGMNDPKKENEFDYTYFGRFRCYPDCEVRANWPNVVKDEEIGGLVEKLSGNKCIVKNLDQVQLAIDTLKKDPTRRSVVLVSWVPSRDSIKFGPKREKTSSPCIVYIQPQIVENKLHLFVVMKTNDLFNAWLLNAYALTELQKYMAEQIGVEVGSYNHFSVSMNIYEDVYEQAEELRR
ncbi:MAG: thymidylate synthase [Candidatus Aenigmarchaeota archaeon]|nr:thymidylate synthase [Candidatus Aenigmarchaeota archaeon]